MIPLREIEKELLKNPAFKEAYDALEPEFALIEKRIRLGLSQKTLAKKIGTKQSAISRLESGESNPTVGFLKKVAKALNAKVKIIIT